jgi:choline/glycine/proline betaine transport protein
VFVSVVTTLLVLAFSIFTIVKPNVSAEFFANSNIAINKNLNWLYVLTMNASLVFWLIIRFSKFENIRLGSYTAKPVYNQITSIKKVYTQTSIGQN